MPSGQQSSQLGIVVDGGGTKTACRVLEISTEGMTILGAAAATGSNPAEIGVDAAVEAILTAVREATRQARLEEASRIERAALAIAGTLDQRLRADLEEALRGKLPANRCRVFPDIVPPLFWASAVGPSIGVIAGTGSVAVARTPCGRCTVAGGWGYLLGDEGSGYAIGREALRYTLEQLEAAHPLSPLATEVLHEAGVATTNELKRYVYASTHPRRTIAGLARSVFILGEHPDARQESIVNQAAQDLARLALRASARLALDWPTTPVAASGGLFAAGETIRAPFRRALVDLGHAGSVRFVDDSLSACEVLLRDDVFDAPLIVEP